MSHKRKQHRSRPRKNKKKGFCLPEQSELENNLPEFVVQAHAAVKAGQIEKANRLFKENAAEVTEELTGKNPLRINIMYVLAKALFLDGQYKLSEDLCENILKLGPNAFLYDFASVYHILGGVCENTGRVMQAVQYFRQAVKTDPNAPGIWSSLAMALVRIGQAREGAALLKKAARMKHGKASLGSNFLLYLNYLPTVDQQVFFDEHKRWGQIHAPTSRSRTSHHNVPDPGRKLRIGYISPDFRMHPVANFFESLLDGHNREEMEIYGYGNVQCPDRTTGRLKSKFDHYRNICGVTDEAAADMIEQDQIDILVDLAGHTNNNRLLVLAYKPAPIQVAYLGYSNTTGMKAVDYRLTDNLADLPESQEFYTEELVFLPGCFSCYRPFDVAPPIAPLPAIRKGYVTFGSFNNSCKIHPFTIGLWAEILKCTGNSHILLRFRGGNDQGMTERYFRNFEELGIPRERVEICGWKPVVKHLQSYAEVDIALDTFPWNGHTTMCEALWMGVPVISLVGKPFVSRVGLSVLSSVGLESFAASTAQEYLSKAVSLAQNLESLAKMRASMRERMFASVLCDARGFADNVEVAYREMWHRWCQEHNVKSLVFRPVGG